MKPLRSSPSYDFLCTLSLTGLRTGVYPSLYRCSGSYGIKVSRPLVPLKFKQLGYVRLLAVNEQIQPGSCSDNARKSNTMGVML
jgi:hypothetical protein